MVPVGCKVDAVVPTSDGVVGALACTVLAGSSSTAPRAALATVACAGVEVGADAVAKGLSGRACFAQAVLADLVAWTGLSTATTVGEVGLYIFAHTRTIGEASRACACTAQTVLSAGALDGTATTVIVVGLWVFAAAVAVGLSGCTEAHTAGAGLVGGARLSTSTAVAVVGLGVDAGVVASGGSCRAGFAYTVGACFVV